MESLSVSLDNKSVSHANSNYKCLGIQQNFFFLFYLRKRGIEFQAKQFLEGTVHGSWCTGGPAILGQLIIGGKKGKDS